MNDTAIQTTCLTRDFGAKRALNGVSLTIPKGRVIALLGPNGAGKSTLLKLLTGLLEPTFGSSKVLGAPSRAMPADICGRLAVMLDGCEPPGWATPRRMIDLQADASPHFDRDAAQTFICSRGLGEHDPYGKMSSGQKRWALAGLCLASGADVLLLDEPAAGFDTAARHEVYDRARDYANERDATVLVATHIIPDIERIADDVAVIREGRLLLHEALEDLRERVREVGLPGQETPPPINHGARWLGAKAVDGGCVAWVMTPDGDEDALRTQLGSDTPISPVGLETLYLALTEHATEEAE